MSVLWFNLELLWVVILSAYVLIFTYASKLLYEWMVRRTVDEKTAVYYNRKLIHIFAGGIPAILVPFVFNSPVYPLSAGLLMTIFTLVSHRSKRLLYWFQTEKNLNDVSFCFMWGITIFILWTFLGNPWIAVIPPVFMAIGDGITGIIRNLVFKRRNKHFIGNIWMAALCIPLGFFLALRAEKTGMENMVLWACLAALAASLVERYEIGPIDDNILITMSSAFILYIGSIIP